MFLGGRKDIFGMLEDCFRNLRFFVFFVGFCGSSDKLLRDLRILRLSAESSLNDAFVTFTFSMSFRGIPSFICC